MTTNSRLNFLAITTILIASIALRFWAFPQRYEMRGVDEYPYVTGSLELLEGIAPGFKHAPAGPQTWLGWGYAGSLSAKYFIFPTAEERAVPVQVRPFVAVNHALFDLYRDLSGIRRFIVMVGNVLSVLAVAAAFVVGRRAAGLAGGVLLGGLFAAAPMIVDLVGQARSFSIGWSLLMIAVYFASGGTKKAFWRSAVFMGLAISQRIDMLILLPAIWIECWYFLRQPPSTDPTDPRPGPATIVQSIATLLRHFGITMAVTLLAAPWLLTNAIGELRTIATVRFSEPSDGPVSFMTTLMEFVWYEGLGFVALLFVAGAVVGLFKRRLRKPLLCLYVLLILPAVLKSSGHGISHQGAYVLALFIAAPLALAGLSASSKVTWGIVGASLLLPLIMTTRAIHQQHQNWIPDDATAWVEAHVPSGTTLFVHPEFHDPLPTPQRADELWQEVMNNEAAMKKFRSGLARFQLGQVEVPHALSEENMIVERVMRRGWYILGSRSWIPDPRYDIRLFGMSFVFGSLEPVQEFSRTGGVLIWRGEPLAGQPEPVAKWTKPNGAGTFIYCSADVREKLKP